MKRSALIVTLILGLLAFACSFGGTTALLTVTQPAAPGVTSAIPFTVKPDDTATSIGQRLEQQGIIRNATLFEWLAKVQSLQSQLRAGTYALSPGMSMSSIMQVLIKGAPEPGVTVTFLPGFRVTEFPYPVDNLKTGHRIDLSTKLPNFNKDNFLKIVKTGKWLDGTPVSQTFWFVPPPQPNVAFALEGYLYPDTYQFNASDDETAVVKRLIEGFGEAICPDPGGPPDNTSFFNAKDTCLAHQATVDKDKKVGIFDAITKQYFVADQVQALYKALTLASIVQREAGGDSDLQGVTNVLYNRYAVSQGKMRWPSSEPVDTYNSLGADATAMYARDTDTPPSDPLKYWTPLQQAAKTVDPDNLYNTNNGVHKGLPPGPISSPDFDVLAAAANGGVAESTAYFFYLHDGCTPPTIHYAVTYAQFQNVIARYSGKCPG